jgi:hypothetical protein
VREMPNQAQEFHKIFVEETLGKPPRISSGFRLDSVHIKAVQKPQRNHGRFPARLPNVLPSKSSMGGTTYEKIYLMSLHVFF